MFKRYLSTINKEAKYTLEYKKYLINSENKQVQSFFHDLPINFNKNEGTVNMIVEIPRYEQGKFEISKKLPYNPIVQDTKKGKLRFINNIYPFHGYPCNYGAISQTWEDPRISLNNKYFGDNDPLDICEIGSTNVTKHEIGDIKKVKILGCLAMIDDGELDWKLLSIDINDKLSDKLNNINDVDIYMPNLLNNLKNWFQNYKLPMNKPINQFAFNGEWLNKDKAIEVIEECHERWKLLVSQTENENATNDYPTAYNTTLIDTPLYNKEPINLTLEDQFSGKDNNKPLEVEEIYYYK